MKQDLKSLFASQSESKKEKVEQDELSLRFSKSRSANEIFKDFSKDAAQVKVLEMLTARSSSDRQKAADSILDRALGKTVDRSVNLNVDVANMSDAELDERIESALTQLGYKGSEGNSSDFVIGEKEPDRCESLEIVQAEPRLSGEVLTIQKTN